MFILDPLAGGDAGGTIPGKLAFHDVVTLQVAPTFAVAGTAHGIGKSSSTVLASVPDVGGAGHEPLVPSG
jgi:hypothetical protein